MEQIISRLIDLVQQTAPQLWQIARQQVHAQLIMSRITIGIGVLLIMGIVVTNMLVFRTYRKHNTPREDKYSDGRTYFSRDHYWDEEGKPYLVGFSILICVIPFAICLANLNNTIMYTLSPDYYAIQVLLQLAK